MCVYPKAAPTARVEHIIDGAVGARPFAFWKVSNDELAAALERARSDARSFERIARQRRRALRFLAYLTQRRADWAIRYAAQRLQAAE